MYIDQVEIQDMKKILSIVFLMAHLCQTSNALTTADAEAFITANGNKTIQDLTRSDLNQAMRRSKFTSYLDKYFNVNRICQNLVGRYWRSMSPDQQSEFIGLYKKMIENIFISKFQEYQGAGLTVTGAKKSGKNVNVFSELSRPGKKSAKVVWTVSEGKKILDIQLEGLSIFRAHRDDFRNILSGNGGNIESFLNELRAKVRP